MSIQRLLRHVLATVLVAFPCAYLLWQWAFLREPVLPGLSYSAFNDRLASPDQRPFWTYAIWVFLVFAVMLVLRSIVDWVLGRVFPDKQPARR